MTSTHDHYRDRLAGLREAIDDETGELFDTLALSVEIETTYRIVLGTGGPHDEVQVTVNRDGDVTGGTYLYAWHGMPGHGEWQLTPDEAQEWADAFGVPELWEVDR